MKKWIMNENGNKRVVTVDATRTSSLLKPRLSTLLWLMLALSDSPSTLLAVPRTFAQAITIAATRTSGLLKPRLSTLLADVFAQVIHRRRYYSPHKRSLWRSMLMLLTHLRCTFVHSRRSAFAFYLCSCFVSLLVSLFVCWIVMCGVVSLFAYSCCFLVPCFSCNDKYLQWNCHEDLLA